VHDGPHETEVAGAEYTVAKIELSTVAITSTNPGWNSWQADNWERLGTHLA
jgi:hypothetical protein